MEQDVHIHLDVHVDNVHIHVNDGVNRKLDDILASIDLLTQTGEQTMADLSALTVEVTNNTDVVNSAVTLIAGLADQLSAAAGDPAQVQALADTLRANNQQLANAVAANTPGGPVVQPGV